MHRLLLSEYFAPTGEINAIPQGLNLGVSQEEEAYGPTIQAGGRGFEPPHTDPESAVLPLDEPPTIEAVILPLLRAFVKGVIIANMETAFVGTTGYLAISLFDLSVAYVTSLNYHCIH